MNDIKSFTIYSEYIDLISLLSKEEQYDLYGKIIDYIFYDAEVINLTRKQIKVWKNLKRPIDKSKTKSINGLKGGAPKGNENAKKQANEQPRKQAKKQANIQPTKQAHSKMSMFNVNVKVKKDNRGMGEEGKKEEAKIHFAEFVTMTNAEYEKLISTYSKDFANQCITVLDNYKGSSGKKYKSDYRAILSWVIGVVEQKEDKSDTVYERLTKDYKINPTTEQEKKEFDSILEDLTKLC